MGLLNISELDRLSHTITGVPGGVLAAAYLEEQKRGSQSRAEPSCPVGWIPSSPRRGRGEGGVRQGLHGGTSCMGGGAGHFLQRTLVCDPLSHLR